MIKMLIIEDDLQLNNALKFYFEKEGYEVCQAFSCAEAEKTTEKKHIDIIIADIGLPDQSGLLFVKNLQKGLKIPIIFLTAKDEEQDILDGYDVGCEEYITKPISPKVLQKKIETILKRRNENDNALFYKEIKIDFEKRRAWKKSTEIKLTAKEWEILSLLAKNKGRIITKDILLENVWGIDGQFVDDHAVTVAINRLRKKIENNVGENVYIKNVFGVGYTFGE